MNKLFFYLNRYSWILVMLFSLMYLSSCRHAVKQGIKKGGKYVAAAILMLAVEEVVAGDLLNIFDDAPSGQKPIQVTINNQYNTQVIVALSKDGHQWEERVIFPNQNLVYNSSTKGLIGVKAGDKFYLLRKAQTFSITKKGGELVLK